MHVLYDARLLHRPLSGIERVQRNVLRELSVHSGIERLGVVVMEGTRVPAGLDSVEIHEVAGTEDILAILLGEDRPDVYHLSWFPDRHPRDLLLPMVAKSSVVEVHDAILNRHPEYHHSRGSWAWYDQFVRRLVGNGDRLLVHSRSVADEVTHDLGGEASRIDRAPLAVDPALREPLPETEIRRRVEKLGFAGLGSYFFALGKDYPHKDHATLFRALARLDDSTHIICAGSKVWHSGEDTDRLLRKLKIESRVHWVQGISDEDVKALLQGSLGLVYPSLEEGFGLPPIEAMALGVPVAASAAMSIPEVCGDGALLFAPGDDSELLVCMQKMSKGGPEIEELVARGRAREALFTWSRCADDTIACYRKAVASARGASDIDGEAVVDVMRIMAASPFSSERELLVFRERAERLDAHARAVEQNRDEILQKLHDAERRLGEEPSEAPPLKAPPPPPPPNGHSRPRWSLKRRLRKIREGIRRRLE